MTDKYYLSGLMTGKTVDHFAGMVKVLKQANRDGIQWSDEDVDRVRLQVNAKFQAILQANAASSNQYKPVLPATVNNAAAIYGAASIKTVKFH